MAHSITPFFNYPAPPPLTNKPYYVDTSSQLQLKDADKPVTTSLRDFDPSPQPPQFEDERQSPHHTFYGPDPTMSFMSSELPYHHAQVHPNSIFQEHQNTDASEFNDQSQEIHEPASMTRRDEYEHDLRNEGRRANYAYKNAPKREERARIKQEKAEQEAKERQEKAELQARIKREKEAQKRAPKGRKKKAEAKVEEEEELRSLDYYIQQPPPPKPPSPTRVTRSSAIPKKTK
jgi:hypothetical protein